MSNLKQHIKTTHEWTWFPSMSAVHILLYAIITFLCTLPWVIIFYPGILEIDTCFQIAEHNGHGYGQGKGYTNLYPLFCVWLFGSINDIFSSIGDMKYGIFAICMFIILGYSIGISLMSCYLEKWNAPKLMRLLPIIMFALLPVFWTSNIDVGKDSVFTVFLIPFEIGVAEILRVSIQNEQLHAKYGVMTALFGSLATLSLSKGLFIVVPTLIVLFIYLVCTNKVAEKSSAMKVVLASIISIFVTLLVMSCFVTNYLIDNSKSTTYRELLGTAVQQTAYAVKNNAVSKEDIDKLNKFYNVDKATKNFDSTITDKTKNYVYLNASSDDIKEFLSAYISIGMQSPQYYSKAWYDLYSGYLEIGTYDSLMIPRLLPNYDGLQMKDIKSQDNVPNDIDTMKKYLKKGYLIYSFALLPEYEDTYPDYANWEMYTDGIETRTDSICFVMNLGSIPIVNFFISKGAYILYLPVVLLLLCVYLQKGQRIHYLILMTPIVINTVIAFMSPIDFSRYVYPSAYLLLFLIPLLFSNTRSI